VLIDKAAMVGETASVPDNQHFGQRRFGRMMSLFLRSLDDKMIALTTVLHKTLSPKCWTATRRDHQDIFTECPEQTDPYY